MDTLSRHRQPWSKAEISALYGYAARLTQKEAAKRLGRTRNAVNIKVHELGIRWGQGTWNAERIAKVVGCTPPTVVRLIRILYRRHELVIAGTKKAPRFKLNDAQAERIIGILKANRKHRTFSILGGQARGRQMTQQRKAREQAQQQ